MHYTICSDVNYLLGNAPSSPTWEFDARSALIGAAAAFVLVGLVYYFRAALRQSRENITTRIAQLSQRLQANAEERYRELLAKHAHSLTVPAHVAPLDAVFVEPALFVPSPPPPSTAEFDNLPDGPRSLPLRQVLGEHPRLAILGAPGAGKTTLLAYVALVCARTVGDNDKVTMTLGAVQERLPLYVPLSTMDWDEADEADAEGEGEEENTKENKKEIDPVDKLVNAAVTAVAGSKGMTNMLREHLKAGQAIVLIDGWDELLPQQRQRAAALISELLHTMPGNVWLVGAEPRGYAPLVEIGFAALKLTEWDAGQVELFARQWVQSYAPIDSPESTAILRQLAATLRHAARAGACPLELALRAFVYLSDEQTPARRAPLFEHVLDSLLQPEKEGEKPWLLPACQTALEQLALDLQQTQRATASREEIEAAIESALPVPEERPARAATHTFRALTGERGLLRPADSDRYTFTHPLWQAYLAARQLAASAPSDLSAPSDISAPSDLAERLDDAHWTETLRFYAAVGDMGPLVAAWLHSPDDIFNTRLQTLGSWIKESPESANWRDGAMAVLARSFLQSKRPAYMQQGLGKTLAATGVSGVTYLFKQALRHPDARMRRVAVMGLTMTGTAGDSDLPTLDAAMTQDPAVREEIIHGLARLGTTAATRWLARIFLEEEETLSIAAAKALAQCGKEGADFLREAVESDDTVARRAAVFGLARIGARDILRKVAREDEQWIVRSAATMALDELEDQDDISGVAPPPEIEQLPWLISWAATKGEGVGLGDAARHMLRRALNEGDAPTRVLASRVLAQLGRPDDVESLRAALAVPAPDVVNAALEALHEISERYALMIE